MRRNNRNQEIILFAALGIPILWFAAAFAQSVEAGGGLFSILDIFNQLMENPLSLRWCSRTGVFLLAATVLYGLGVICYLQDRAGQRPGAEHGTARWGTAAKLNSKYRNKKEKDQNYLLSKHVEFSMDSHKHQHNLNVMVIGGSGSGKTRYYVKPNAMQCSCSYFFLDPKSELLRSLGGLYEKKGIAVSVIDLIHFKGHYNPMKYVQTDEDAMKLAHALVFNTKSKNTPTGGDEFWDNSSVMLISSIILYLIYEAPPEDHNLNTLLYMIQNCRMDEEGMGKNPLQCIFEKLEDKEPDHPAVLQFNSFMLGAAKTIQSVLLTATSKLHIFNSRQFAEMTSRDETFLEQLGTEKRAIFCVIPDNDDTFNFLVTILYTQLFDSLFRLADSDPRYNGALPVHVRLLMDEFANVALPQNFKNILAVCRSRNLSCDIILQSIAQLKSLFKDDWEGIVGNCDTLVYLGGNEYGTYEYLSKIMGKETEHTKSQSFGHGSHGSSSESIQTTARDLCTPDEIRRMNVNDCLLLMRSEDPVVDRKYDLLRHPNIRYTPDGGGEAYEIPDDLMAEAMPISLELVEEWTSREITPDIYEELEQLEKSIQEKGNSHE